MDENGQKAAAEMAPTLAELAKDNELGTAEFLLELFGRSFPNSSI